MSWRQRIRELILAGGVFGVSACGTSRGGAADAAGGSQGGPPCGNANPDPCICGRPDADAKLAMQCEKEKPLALALGVGATIVAACRED